MRTITEHHVNACNRAIRIEASDPESTGAPRVYIATVNDGVYATRLEFQHGPIEKGVNGLTNEVLLAILIDRLRGFQSGPFADHFNSDALVHLGLVQRALLARTEERIERGVEGTHTV